MLRSKTGAVRAGEYISGVRTRFVPSRAFARKRGKKRSGAWGASLRGSRRSRLVGARMGLRPRMRASGRAAYTERLDPLRDRRAMKRTYQPEKAQASADAPAAAREWVRAQAGSRSNGGATRAHASPSDVGGGRCTPTPPGEGGCHAAQLRSGLPERPLSRRPRVCAARVSTRRGWAARLGLSVSRKVGGAVDRNHVKRLLREAFALESTGCRNDAVVVARPDAKGLAEREGLAGIRRALGDLVGKASGVEDDRGRGDSRLEEAPQ